MEIYNERIRDLLSRDKDNVKIREGANGVYLEEVEQLRSQTLKGVARPLVIKETRDPIQALYFNRRMLT